MLKKLLKKLDNAIDKNWQEFYEFINHIFKQDEYDRDWSKMNKFINEKQWEEYKTKTYLEETKNLKKWTKK